MANFDELCNLISYYKEDSYDYSELYINPIQQAINDKVEDNAEKLKKQYSEINKALRKCQSAIKKGYKGEAKNYLHQAKKYLNQARVTSLTVSEYTLREVCNKNNAIYKLLGGIITAAVLAATKTPDKIAGAFSSATFNSMMNDARVKEQMEKDIKNDRVNMKDPRDKNRYLYELGKRYGYIKDIQSNTGYKPENFIGNMQAKGWYVSGGIATAGAIFGGIVGHISASQKAKKIKNMFDTIGERIKQLEKIINAMPS